MNDVDALISTATWLVEPTEQRLLSRDYRLGLVRDDGPDEVTLPAFRGTCLLYTSPSPRDRS